MTGAADFSANEMYEQCLPVSGENFSPMLSKRKTPMLRAQKKD